MEVKKSNVIRMNKAVEENDDRRTTVPAARKHHFDFPLFIVLMLICAFGLVMLFSASYYYAQSKFGDGLYYVKRQILFMGMGLAGLLVLSHVKYTIYKKLSIAAYLALIALLVATLIIGEEKLGAKRWINLGFTELQPSELAKIVLIIVAATVMTNKQNKMDRFFQGVVPLLVYMLIPCVLIILQPNLSMVIIIGLITFFMLYLGGAKWWHLLLMFAAGAVAVILLAIIEPYRFARIQTFIADPWSDPSDSGYQVVQSLYALGNGGLFGQGINYSRQKLLFLPYRESDFIFSIIGEEIGFVGCILLLLAYLFVIYRGFRIAMRCRDRFGSLTAAGITAMLAIQVIINVAIVTNSIPATGQNLPFISSGGTSLLVFMGAMGILLNISRYTELKAEVTADEEE